MSKLSIAAVAGLAITAAATARPSYTGGGVTIPDNVPAGITNTITVSDSFTIGAGTTVSFGGLNHTWVGDLIIRIRHVPSNTTATLINRPGVGAGSTFGNSADFVASNSYAFADGGAAFPTASPPTVIPSGTYAPATAFAAFNGLNSAGQWEIFASDNAGGDTGGWNSWTLTLVPTPGAAAVFGLAGLAGLRRRR